MGPRDMTLPIVQSVAAVAVKDLAQGSLLRKISKIGARGALPGHLHRDMVRMLRKHGRALQAFPRRLRLCLQNGSDSIGKFWVDFPAPACLARDGRHDFRQKCIPLAVHGDGVAISQVARTGSKKVGCINWQSLLCKKQTALSSFLMIFAFGHQIKEEGYFRTAGHCGPCIQASGQAQAQTRIAWLASRGYCRKVGRP